MPARHVISRIQSIEDRINEIKNIGTTSPKKENPKTSPTSPNGETFSGILDEVMKSQNMDSLNLLNNSSNNESSVGTMDALIEVYKQNGIMPTSKPKPILKNMINSSNPGTWDNIIEQAAQITTLDPRLIHAVIQAESAYDPKAVSKAGAEGLMQLIPETAKQMGVSDSFDPHQNIFGGSKYLKEMLDRYDGDLIKALAAYNAGPNAVDRAGGIPNYKETKEYVPRVLNYYYNMRTN